MFKVIVEYFDYIIAFMLLILWIAGEVGGIMYIRECRREQKDGKEEILRYQEPIRNKSSVHDTARAKSKRKKLSM